MIEEAAARQAAMRLLDTYAPKTVIACERAGISADGTYRNALGQDYSEGREKLDYVVLASDAVCQPSVSATVVMRSGWAQLRKLQPTSRTAMSSAEMATDVLIPAGVSNWGCYAVAAALAILKNNPKLAHTTAAERRLLISTVRRPRRRDVRHVGCYGRRYASRCACSVVELLSQTVRSPRFTSAFDIGF